MSLILRREEPKDYRAVEEMIRESFWNLNVPGCDEHYLAHLLRTHPDFIPQLDFVAEKEGQIVGSILYTRSFVIDKDGHRLPTLTFGPLCVRPGYQRQGIGRALIEHTFSLARKMGEKAVLILGHPHNYCRYGFKNGRDYQISDSHGKKYPYGQLVFELSKGVFRGKTWRFEYSPVYEVKEQEAIEFDRSFEPREKGFQSSQEEFLMAVRAYLE